MDNVITVLRVEVVRRRMNKYIFFDKEQGERERVRVRDKMMKKLIRIENEHE